MPPTPYHRRFQKQVPSQAPNLTEKLIALRFGSEQYAIPMRQVQSVLNNFTAYGALETGQSLVMHNQGIITLIDSATLFLSQQAIAPSQFLVICLLDNGELLGIPTSEMPTILEADLSKLATLPMGYRQGRLSPAIEKLIPVPDSSVVFYINVERLLPVVVY
ncbi:chemotaxis protein CheW [Trichocoleus sp. FACHB-591]|uniref:chemotaxis protein CheW n=1 Tax=Trichocoleus sp. FACHB-591 TaxID=2692872 RepID=UPI00168672EB|nr:chemotaxis protein CheW [Trichocoleus sp. FACHB-591]MBD2097195.1 chemotaxis protein CheW [Trichocoleus sp. FACHB-591]